MNYIKQIILMILAFIFLLLLGYYMLVASCQKLAVQLKTEKSILLQKKNHCQKNIEEKRDKILSCKKYENMIRFSHYFPTEHKIISNCSIENGLRMKQNQSFSEKLIFFRTFFLVMNGSYSKLIDFLRCISQNNALVLHDFNLYLMSNNQDMDPSIHIKGHVTFSALGDNSCEPLFNHWYSKHDPFKVNQTAVLLNQFTLKEIRYLGLIKNQKKTVGYVEDPKGIIQKVHIGDEISINHTTILDIQPNRLVTES